MNASSIEDATEIDYFITNVEPSKVTPEWIVIVVLIKIETKIEYNKIKLTRNYFELCLTV
ncbi:MAG: hypothetical protein MGU50_16745 [Trichodesmium sp. MAG_R02]|nr:hypothetical protein [Trichodesmium sp. MAG_R02]